MKVSDIIHPDDASALNNLKSIPALPTLIEKVMQYGYEEIQWSNNIASKTGKNEKAMVKALEKFLDKTYINVE